MSDNRELAMRGQDLPAETTAQRESQRAIAEVQAAMILARQFPRDERKVLDKILVACQRPSLAEQALYSYQRGGNDITGPSIRLAEAIAQLWTNIQFGIRELSQSHGESKVEAFAWDVENNTRQVKEFQVPHVRYSKSAGNTRLTDPRDIYETVANSGARRLRACILGVIPGDIVDQAVRQCEETLKSQADTSPGNIQKMVDAFKKYNITKEMIEKRIQRNIGSITPAQMVNIRKIWNSLEDGMSNPWDWFDMKNPNEAPKFNIPEDVLSVLNTLFTQLDMNTAERNMKLGECEGSGEKITKLVKELQAKIKEKNEAKGEAAEQPKGPLFEGDKEPKTDPAAERGELIDKITVLLKERSQKPPTKKEFDAMSLGDLRAKLKELEGGQ